MTDINISAAFKMEPKEIVKYFESKGLKPSWDWHEVYEDAHAKAFTVAKMVQADLFNDTHKMLTTAIKEGWGEGKFKKNAGELFKKKGWTGHIFAVDSQGVAKKIELGTPRRIKKIFQCNMHSAYAVGRYKEQMENADVAPYLQYVAILDNRTRPEHSAMHGKVFRYDDPIWNTMYPPNGWNCRCMVTQLTAGMVKRKNLKIETSGNNLREVTEDVGGEEKSNTVYTFEKDGNVYHLKPDAGWGTNLGIKAWNLDVLAYSKIKELPQPIKDKFISTMAQNVHNEVVFKNFVSTIIKNNLINKSPIKEIPITWISPNILKELTKTKLTPKTPIIVLQDERIGHILDRKVNITDFISIYEIINNPDEVYYDFTRSGDVGLAFIRFIDDNFILKVCVKLDKLKRKQLVNYVSTVGKVPKSELLNKKMYKKIG